MICGSFRRAATSPMARFSVCSVWLEALQQEPYESADSPVSSNDLSSMFAAFRPCRCITLVPQTLRRRHQTMSHFLKIDEFLDATHVLRREPGTHPHFIIHAEHLKFIQICGQGSAMQNGPVGTNSKCAARPWTKKLSFIG